ncbi:MAG TPA: hypothetical protein VLE97_09680 [Gaiellaceae bacterium]|nr:hypothetical protein [Gaiellaceae bacterium]
MSKNRENVIWQSPHGTWNRGFFDYYVTGPDDEWDVEYDHRRFNWVTTGLPSEDAAREAWAGANPGGYQRIPWNETNRAEIARYDAMAAEHEKHEKEHGGTSRRGGKSPAQLDRDIRAVLAKRKKPYSW